MTLPLGEDSNVGFKDYDDLIFNGNKLNDSLSPFTSDLWNKTMKWYGIFSTISGSLILIAVFILGYKIIVAGMNTARKNEAKESLMRLCFGGVAIALAPIFIRFMLFLNNSMVYLLLNASNNASLGDKLGESMLTSISTGNAIATALVIAMFIYLFVKLNIKFIVRQFTIIIFTIFTPVAAGLWIINKNVTAASILGDLSAAIDLISKTGSSEEGTSAINTLNGLLAGLMKYDSDHYEAMDVALADAMRKLEKK